MRDENDSIRDYSRNKTVIFAPPSPALSPGHAAHCKKYVPLARTLTIWPKNMEQYTAENVRRRAGKGEKYE